MIIYILFLCLLVQNAPTNCLLNSSNVLEVVEQEFIPKCYRKNICTISCQKNFKKFKKCSHVLYIDIPKDNINYSGYFFHCLWSKQNEILTILNESFEDVSDITKLNDHFNLDLKFEKKKLYYKKILMKIQLSVSNIMRLIEKLRQLCSNGLSNYSSEYQMKFLFNINFHLKMDQVLNRSLQLFLLRASKVLKRDCECSEFIEFFGFHKKSAKKICMKHC